MVRNEQGLRVKPYSFEVMEVIKALAAELAKGLKTEADLNQFSRKLTKLTVETAL